MYKVILDTDFLVHSITNRVDIFEELKRVIDYNFEVYILDKTIDELMGKKNSKLVLDIVRKKAKVLETNKKGNVDELILGLEDKNLIICTDDAKLKEKLKKRNIPIITLRQGKFLVLKNVL